MLCIVRICYIILIKECGRSGLVLKRFEMPECPVEITLLLMGNRAGTSIIRDLLSGPKRLCELSKSITTVSTKMITQHLRIMEENGLVTRKVFPEVPPHVEYNLTEIGLSLEPIISAMWNWGSNYKNKYSAVCVKEHLEK